MEEQDKVIDGQEDQKETKTYSDEEVQKMLQSETDKRVSQALKTAQEKWQKEFEAKLEAEKSEAEKLAKMSESEKQQAELQKMKEQFESERKQFMREKLELETVKQLSSNGLPTDFSKFVLADDAETINNNIKSFKEQWEKAIEKAVNEKLQGVTPKTATKQGTKVTKEQFAKMGYKDRMALYESDPDLYNQLKG